MKTAVDHAAGGGEHADIPEAKYDEGEEVPEARTKGWRRGRGRRERRGEREQTLSRCEHIATADSADHMH